MREKILKNNAKETDYYFGAHIFTNMDKTFLYLGRMGIFRKEKLNSNTFVIGISSKCIKGNVSPSL